MHFNVQFILTLACGAAILDFELGTVLQAEVVGRCSRLRIRLASLDVGRMFSINKLIVTKHVEEKQTNTKC